MFDDCLKLFMQPGLQAARIGAGGGPILIGLFVWQEGREAAQNQTRTEQCEFRVHAPSGVVLSRAQAGSVVSDFSSSAATQSSIDMRRWL